MGIEIICCGKCYDALKEKDPKLAEMWGDICARYVQKKLKPIKWSNECQMTQFLEINRYIVTSDPISGRLVVLPRGLQVIKGQHFFCIKFESHQTKE